MHTSFRNRTEAAELLVEKWQTYQGTRPLVLVIPRGAVSMGKIIAEALGGELDVILIRKLGLPENPEVAVGAVDESGHVELDSLATMVQPSMLEQEIERQKRTIRERRKRYTPIRPPIDPKDRTVIIVDDGIATGSTMRSAIRAVRARHPEKIVIATAVAPPDTIEALQSEADDIICLLQPTSFMAVSQFFDRFEQVTDEEVVEMLKQKSNS